ncbi:hypothetical protein C1646_702991, partial [Rhizophagus diaphanus]
IVSSLIWLKDDSLSFNSSTSVITSFSLISFSFLFVYSIFKKLLLFSISISNSFFVFFSRSLL